MSELRVVVAIPARNEAERIEACLSALARQRDRRASPLPTALYSVLVYADSCTDATVETVRAWAGRTSFPVRLVAEASDAREAHAGRARRRAMDLAAEVLERDALCAPIAHDPWPNHRVSSGASLAVRLAAYRAVGGMPSERVGEDAAFTRALEAAGFRVRHALSVQVSTSCRFVGRVTGGTADTMRHRHETSDADCATTVVSRHESC